MAKESPFVKDKASTNALTLSRRNFIAQTGLGTAAILMNGIPCAAAYSALDKALPHGEAADEKAAWAPTHVSLDGKWKLFYFPQGKHQVSEPRQLKAAGLTAIDATVPGYAPLELSRIGELPADLIAGLNTTKMRPYELYEWWYQREFPTPAGIAGKRLELCFNGVDCLATYWLNGAKIGGSDNALIAHSFNVTDKLNVTGPNTITVRLRSAELEAVGKNYDPAYTVSAGPNNQEGVWIRKPAHSWGWNIMPRSVSSGLWRSVELIVHAPQEIPELYFATLSVEPGKAELHVSYNVTTELTLLPQLQLKVKGECGDSTFSHLHHLEFSAGRFSIPVANPRLWWPRGYGEASLYKVTTQLLQGEKVLATREDTIGIRKLELIRTETTTPDK